MQPSSNGRADAIRADDDVAGHRPSAGQLEHRRSVANGDAGRFAAELDRVLSDGLEQRAVKGRPKRHERPLIRPIATDVGELHAPADAAIGPAEFHDTRVDGLRGNGVSETERAERGHCVGGERQSKTKLPGSGGALEHAHLPPGAAKRQRGRESADAGADDEG